MYDIYFALTYDVLSWRTIVTALTDRLTKLLLTNDFQIHTIITQTIFTIGRSTCPFAHNFLCDEHPYVANNSMSVEHSQDIAQLYRYYMYMYSCYGANWASWVVLSARGVVFMLEQVSCCRTAWSFTARLTTMQLWNCRWTTLYGHRCSVIL